MILDGHHRVRAAKELGIKEIEVRIPELIGIDEDEYLLSVALNRRHLTEGQKAVLANEYRKIISEKAKSERANKANDIKHDHPISLSETSTDKEKEEDTRKAAAEKFKISEWKVRQASKIETDAPEIYAQVKSGNLALHEAVKIIKEPEPVREIIMQRKHEEPRKNLQVIIRDIHNKDRIDNPKSLPEGKYAVIYADPPWKYDFVNSDTRGVSI